MYELVTLDDCIYELTDTQNPIGRQIDMFYSELDPYWTDKGGISSSTVDTGEGILFHCHSTNKTYQFDYAQLFTLLKSLNKLGYENER